MILLTKNEQHIAFLVRIQLGHNRINNTLQLGHNRIYSSIHSFIYIHSSTFLLVNLHTWWKIPIYITFFIYSIDQSLLILFIYLNQLKECFTWTVPRCGSNRVAAVVEEEVVVDSGSGIGGGRRQRWSRERRELREFWNEKWNDTERAIIYRFKNISSGFGLKLLLIVLESETKRFWFKITAGEDIISNGLKLEPLLIS
jgi:hypothetical protein